MEIERKFTIKKMPEHLEDYPSTHITQAYLGRKPVLRVREENGRYSLSVKSGKGIAHLEENIAITPEQYRTLSTIAIGRIIEKTRYRIPAGPYTVELDVFEGELAGLVMAEVEFPTLEEAEAFAPLDWFLEDVSHDERYHNAHLCTAEEIPR